MNWGTLQSLHIYTEIGWPPVSKCAKNEVYRREPYPRDLNREHPHPPRPKFTGPSLASDELEV